ncbi:MAG: hypothetical protein IPJ51_11015 [Saprospiraceae bacterium]|nr:hypothetical protein [Saprospiraceae bacterium]
MANTELIEFLPDTCSPQSVPHTYGCIGTRGQDRIPNTYGFDLPTDFGTTNATDTYLHAVDDNVGGITYFYPPSTSNPTSPVVATNVAAIQSFLTSIGSGITYTINAFNEIVLTYAALGDENRWSFWMGTSNPDGYTNKLLPTLHDLRVDTVTYQEVQIIKQQNNDGTYADKFFLPSGNSALTEVALAADQTFKFGNCPDCKKEIFATHQRFYLIPGIPVGAVAYEMTNDLPTQGLDVSNAYFHLIYPTLNGTQNIAYGPQLTDYFANPQLGILWSDIAGVQAVIDFVLPLMNLSVGDVVYAINTTNTPIFLLSPTAVAELANNTYLHIYWGDTDVHSSYNETADVNVIAANPNILLGGANKCVGIQEIKEKDTCTGEETYRYVIEDLNGDLVNVTSIYPDFVEADVLLECPAVSKTVDVPNCAGTLVEKEVDSIVGAYILNQENKHTETVYDIVNAAIGGTITYTYTSPTNIALNLNTVTVTNDSLVGFWTDFGDGYNDFGNVPDHSYNADGSYEIKTYAILNSKNKILINAKEVIITNGVVAYAPTGTSSTINRPYRHVVNTALQNYCGNTPVDNPYLADGTSYTPTGTLGLHLDAIIDELEDNAEWNPENVADLVECEVISGGGVVTEGVDANLNAISTLLGIPTPDNRHILLGNTLSISSIGSSNVMAAGLNVAATGLITGAQFTFNIDLIADSDPGDPADFGVVVWDNVAGTSVLATSITAPFPMSYDPQGSGLNFPIYANPVAPQSFQVVWTGDLPLVIILWDLYYKINSLA